MSRSLLVELELELELEVPTLLVSSVRAILCGLPSAASETGDLPRLLLPSPLVAVLFIEVTSWSTSVSVLLRIVMEKD